MYSLSVFSNENTPFMRFTHSSIVRTLAIVFDSIFSVGKHFVRMFHAHRICKPNRRTKYLTPVKYRKDVNTYKKGGGKLSTKKFFCLLEILSLFFTHRQIIIRRGALFQGYRILCRVCHISNNFLCIVFDY